ncbi:MAG: hypothetical protein JW997_00355 [Actinobacteria bacterium]|nr:hypothetical protein [Actinomycetota bacterium]
MPSKSINVLPAVVYNYMLSTSLFFCVVKPSLKYRLAKRYGNIERLIP